MKNVRIIRMIRKSELFDRIMSELFDKTKTTLNCYHHNILWINRILCKYDRIWRIHLIKSLVPQE